ncbi:uncharacterized protein LOC121733383 [Aricia agestis]|uniref:uncharacterized protein LOC121733383 n=1 Tax=Aricia agestis TaxID=91739 RepID=UPI001C203D03|nr:uncharacterized protein LOC121733383 [Aricia agestis]
MFVSTAAPPAAPLLLRPAALHVVVEALVEVRRHRTESAAARPVHGAPLAPRRLSFAPRRLSFAPRAVRLIKTIPLVGARAPVHPRASPEHDMSLCARADPAAADGPLREGSDRPGQEEVTYALREVPARMRILDLLRPTELGKDGPDLSRPLPRRGLVRPYDDDTRRFLQQILLDTIDAPPALDDRVRDAPDESGGADVDEGGDKRERSLADELREAEEEERTGSLRRELLREFRRRGGAAREALERDRLGRLALAVEQDEDGAGQGEDAGAGLGAAARRLDALLAESRSLQVELAGIRDDMQADCARACRCADAARALAAQSRAVRYLDDVVALLRGEVAAVARARDWPFALGPRSPDRNYVV